MGGFSDEGNQVQTALLERCDAVLLGRQLTPPKAGVGKKSNDDARRRRNGRRAWPPAHGSGSGGGNPGRGRHTCSAGLLPIRTSRTAHAMICEKPSAL